MDRPTSPCDPETRRRVFHAFYRLPARQVMDPTLEKAAFIGLHTPVLEALGILAGVDHAWVVERPGEDRRVRSILLRRDLVRALQPAEDSYSRLVGARSRSLAHGAADCTCCFTEGRVLHGVGPEAPCRQVVHLMNATGALYIPVLEGNDLVGEIGSLQVIRALHRIHRELEILP